MKNYDAANWYWIIRDAPKQGVWSSQRRAFIGADDTDYVQWLRGDDPAIVGTIAELDASLRATGQPGCIVTTADVRSEAQRRIIVVTGSNDLNSCIVKQLNALMRSQELTIKGRKNWDDAEKIEASRLEELADKIKSIRAVSNVIEVNPPLDYRDDTRWPK